MATYGWRTNHSVEDFLFKKGYRFDFYQAVRLLEIMNPDKIPVAEGSEPEKEPARFKSKVSLEFPASDISEVIRLDPEHKTAEMIVNFMGLAGCIGPLPLPYTELILERVSRKDTALRDFIDIFNHRLISLMYRIHKTYRIGFEFKSPDQTPFARYLFSFFGMGTKGLRNRMKVKDRALLFYAGILGHQPRSMRVLEQIIGNYFKVNVKGKQFNGQWYPIEQEQITRIGIFGINHILGKNAVLGTRVWFQSYNIGICLGPISFLEFIDFLPLGSAYLPICDIIRFYIGIELEFNLSLILKNEEIPELRLDSKNISKGPRLGWTSWLNTGKYKRKFGHVNLFPRLLSSNYYPEHICRNIGVD